MEKKLILLVDDDLPYLKMIRGSLVRKYRVIPAVSGAHAVSIATVVKPDLLLLDYLMPEMDGSQVLRELRKHEETADIPVMFLTGKNDAPSVHKVMEDHPAGYILKSMKIQEIMSIVDRQMGYVEYENDPDFQRD
jgi:putative two-component system response regulator